MVGQWGDHISVQVTYLAHILAP